MEERKGVRRSSLFSPLLFTHSADTLSILFRLGRPGARGMAAAQFVSISKSSLKESQRYVKGALSSHDFAPLSLISRKQNERKNPKRKIEREKKRRRRRRAP